MATYARAPDIGRPVIYHAQAAIAQRALEAAAAIRSSRVAELPIVTKHVPPWRQVALDELPRSAASFARAAVAAGLEVAARMAGARAAQVGVRERHTSRLWQRATWQLTAAGAWQSRRVLVDGRVVGILEAKRRWAE